MITSLSLKNFKCFDDVSIPLKPLTLFTGLNGTGKSTSLQTLLLLAQTYRARTHHTNELTLNGPLCGLGTPGDIINQRRGGNYFELGFATEHGAVMWRLSVHPQDRRAVVMDAVEPVASESDHTASQRATEAAVSALDQLIYLSAARQVETEVFPSPQGADRFVGNVGVVGQFAAYWFDQEKDNEVPAARCVDRTNTGITLQHQLNAWASELFQDVEMNAVHLAPTSLLRLELRTGLLADWGRPSNIGYGMTYAFPVLLAALIAPPQSTFVIDSPEAHLHPAAQAAMGRFLAKMSACGVQILIETHSDHVMDGVRIAVRDGILKNSEAGFHYFDRSNEGVNITSPTIDEDGKLSEWPRGFFDQHRRSAAKLLRPRSGEHQE